MFNSSNTSIYLQFKSGQWLSLTMTTKYRERSLLPLLLLSLIITIIVVDYATIEGESRRPWNLFRLIQTDF